MAPCAAWNARTVGRPGGGGSNACRVKYPAIAASTVSTAAGSAARADRVGVEDLGGRGTSVEVQGREQPNEVDERGTDRRARPVDDNRPCVGDQQVVGPEVAVDEAVAAHRIVPGGLEIGQAFEVATAPRVERLDRVAQQPRPVSVQTSAEGFSGDGDQVFADRARVDGRQGRHRA